jgi:hypothetical protein
MGLFIARVIYEYEEPRWNNTNERKQELGDKPVSVSLSPPRGLFRARILASAVRGRQLTA